jgi:hypothetical protein
MSSDQREKAVHDRWHRHPLLIAGFSIAIGSGLVGWVQNCASERKALRDKRYAIAEEVVQYVARLDTNLRILDSTGKAIRHKHLSQPSFLKAQADVQSSFNANAELQNKIELDLSLYFSNEKPLDAFSAIRTSYFDAFNSGVRAWESNTDWSGELQSHMNAITSHAQQFICSLKSDLRIKNIGAGKCD